jgi:hypothetical protein
MISFSLPRLISSLGLLEGMMDNLKHELNTLLHPTGRSFPTATRRNCPAVYGTTSARKNGNLRNVDPSIPMAFAATDRHYHGIAMTVTEPEVGARTHCEQMPSFGLPTRYIVEGLLYSIATTASEYMYQDQCMI